MSNTPERRSQPDRRRAPRGGRRPSDEAGFAPLVLVVGDREETSFQCEAILARLRFAVTPAPDVAGALVVIDTIHPDLIVAAPTTAERLRRETGTTIPIVEFNAESRDCEALVERIREAIRRHRDA